MLVHATNIMRANYNFISLEGKPFPAVSTNFKKRSLILINQQSLSLKSTLHKEASVSIFAISDFSSCGWYGGRDGGCDSLDCYTCDSPWHHFLCPPVVFLKDMA